MIAAYLALALISGAGDRVCNSKIRVGGGCGDQSRISFEQFDHSEFDALLRRYVDCHGLVCYRDWKADCSDRARLQAYLESLSRVETADPEAAAESKTALYVNAYNALTIWAILREYPTPSIQKHNPDSSGRRIFDDVEVFIGGDAHSLNGIEHDVLRPMGDPRIHFALVCAAKGCPRLRNEAYEASKLHWQFDDNARHFFAQKKNAHVNPATGRVHLSSLLKWYHDDFGSTDAAVLQAIRPYLPCGVQRAAARRACPTIGWLGYNWALNDQCPTACVRIGSVPYAVYAKMEPFVRPIVSKRKSAENAAEGGGAGDAESTANPDPMEDSAESISDKNTTDDLSTLAPESLIETLTPRRRSDDNQVQPD